MGAIMSDSQTTTNKAPRIRAMQPTLTVYDLARQFQRYEEHVTTARNGQWIIGFGHRTDTRLRTHVTLEEATYILENDIDNAARALNQALETPVSQGCFDALTDWLLATDRETVERSETIRALNLGWSSARARFKYEQLGQVAPIHFERWRRACELELWGSDRG